MSGGSHDYIGRCYSFQDVLEKVSMLPGVAKRLKELGHQDAADATLALVREPENLHELINVWGEVDLLDSHDHDEEQVAEAVEAWRRAPHSGERSKERLPTYFIAITVEAPAGKLISLHSRVAAPTAQDRFMFMRKEAVMQGRKHGFPMPDPEHAVVTAYHSELEAEEAWLVKGEPHSDH